MPSFSEEYPLGKPIATCESNERLSSFHLTLAGFIFILGLVAGALGIYFTPLRPYRDQLLVVAVTAIVISIIYAYSAFRVGVMRVVVATEGLICIKGDRPTAWRWDEIEWVKQANVNRYRNGLSLGITYKYTLRRKDGKQVVFTNRLKNVAWLGNTIQKEVARQLVPNATETYNSGETVRFGPVSLSHAGFGRNKQLLKWGQVQSIRIDRGYMLVRKPSGFFPFATIPLSEIPNLGALSVLLESTIGIPIEAARNDVLSPANKK
jgi:hypothetical protein